MTSLAALWLPILLSSVLVFVLSSVVHMVLPWHKNDYGHLPNEDDVTAALRPFNMPPGDYMVPRPATREDLRSPAFMEKMQRGPVMVMTVLPNGAMSMTGNLVGWFVYIVVVGIFAGYVSSRALAPGANYLRVFRFAGVTAFACYSVALWQMTIWYKRSMGTTIRATIDGLIYACFTAGMFGWLWPR